MDLREEILKEHSRAHATKIAEWIGGNKKRFAHLMELFLNAEYRVVQRAAWIVAIVGEKHPNLLLPHFDAMIEQMNTEGLPSAVRRNVLKVLQTVSIPKRHHGRVMDAGFQFLADPGQEVAVRCCSMSVLAHLAKDYPEIVQELKTVIENAMTHKTTAGFKARARKVTGQLENL